MQSARPRLIIDKQLPAYQCLLPLQTIYADIKKAIALNQTMQNEALTIRLRKTQNALKIAIDILYRNESLRKPFCITDDEFKQCELYKTMIRDMEKKIDDIHLDNAKRLEVKKQQLKIMEAQDDEIIARRDAHEAEERYRAKQRDLFIEKKTKLQITFAKVNTEESFGDKFCHCIPFCVDKEKIRQLVDLQEKIDEAQLRIDEYAPHPLNFDEERNILQAQYKLIIKRHEKNYLSNKLQQDVYRINKRAAKKLLANLEDSLEQQSQAHENAQTEQAMIVFLRLIDQIDLLQKDFAVEVEKSSQDKKFIYVQLEETNKKLYDQSLDYYFTLFINDKPLFTGRLIHEKFLSLAEEDKGKIYDDALAAEIIARPAPVLNAALVNASPISSILFQPVVQRIIPPPIQIPSGAVLRIG